MKNTVILGASPKEERYANMAQKLLIEKGHEVYPVNPAYENIDGVKCYPDLKSISDAIDTVTLYMGEERTIKLADDIIKLKPKRVIFNPGTESDALEDKLKNAGIETVKACTLVLLKTGRY